jgi:hypothetical protein
MIRYYWWKPAFFRYSHFQSNVLQKSGVTDFEYESSFIPFLKPNFKLTFGYVQGCYSYFDSATQLPLRNWPSRLPGTIWLSAFPYRWIDFDGDGHLDLAIA